MKARRNDHSWAAKVSHGVLIAIVIITAVVFGVYYTSPESLTDALLIFIYALIAVAALLVALSITGLVRRLRK